MKHWRRTLAGAFALAGVCSVAGIAQQTAASPQSGEAPQRAATTDHHSANVPQVVAALGITTGSHVADVGAGDGAYTVPLARAVGNEGRVYAVDIDDRALTKLRARVEREGLQNVDIIKGEVDDPKLPAGRLDAMLVMHAYHEMTAYKALLPRFREALKPGGRLVIVEPLSPSRREAPRSSQVRGHEIAPWFVSDELRAAGLHVTELRDPYSTHNRHDEWLLVARPTTGPGRLPSVTASETEPAGLTRQPGDPPAERGTPSDHVHDDFTEADLAVPEIRMSMKDFVKEYEAGRVVVVDVRDAEIFAEGHIPGALSIPLHQMEKRFDELKGRLQRVVTYCSCPAEESSARAVLMLERLRMTGARALIGGYEQWLAEKRPVAK